MTTNAASTSQSRSSPDGRPLTMAWDRCSMPPGAVSVTSRPALGGGSQIMERRAGFFNGFSFIDHPGGSLIHDRANEHARPRDGHRVERQRLHLPRVAESVRRRLRRSDRQQHPGVDRRGNSRRRCAGRSSTCRCSRSRARQRIGRFGWKAQQASLRLVLCRCLSQRDGHHQPAATDREHVERRPGGRRRRRR